MITVTLKYGSARITSAPTWGQMKALHAARTRAAADPEHSLDLHSEAIRAFVVDWAVTDPDGNALTFPQDVDRLYTQDVVRLFGAISDMIAANREDKDPNA